MRKKMTIDCSKCENRGKVRGLSQETFCSQCVHYGESWKKDYFKEKQEPFECWVNQFSSGLAYGPWLTYEEAKKWATGSIRTIHMREVVDE